MAKIDLEGNVYGRLTVLSTSEIRGGLGRRRAFWLCRCECGVEKFFPSGNLKTGTSKSCGCLRRELVSAKFTKHGCSPGGKKSKELKAWHHAKARCFNPNTKYFYNYGGRGISMSDEWVNDASQFLKDMGPCPAGHTLDRKDVNLGYSKENCRWASWGTQNGNRRDTVYVEGVCVAQYARTHNLVEWKLRRRMLAGMPEAQAIMESKKTTP